MLQENLEREKLPNTFSLILLYSTFFLLIYFPPGLHRAEFRWRKEALYTAIGMEMNLSKPNTIAHGEIISETYPFYPILIALWSKLGFPVESAGRFISVLFIFAASVLIYYAAYQAYDKRTALFACAFNFSTVLIMEKGIEGMAETMSFFWLLCAWLSWFSLGMYSGRWNLAWLVSFFFCGLSFYTTGWEALFYFFLPLIFMRRPLAIWTRIRKYGFFFGIIILAFFVIFWSYPRLVAGYDIPFRNISREFRVAYLSQVFYFPFDLFFRTFPWIPFLYPVFCAEYDSLERNPVFSRFLKTIFYTIFLLNWFLPYSESREYYLMFMPLSILAGSHYEIFMRRYSSILAKSYVLLLRLIFACSIVGMIFFLSPNTWLGKIPIVKENLFYSTTEKTIGIIFCVVNVIIFVINSLCFHSKKMPAFIHCFSSATALMILFWAFIAPYRIHTSEFRSTASIIRDALGDDFSPDITIYQSQDLSKDFYGIFVYLGCKGKRLQKGVSEIPKNLEKVFYLSYDVPLAPERKWTKRTNFRTRRGEVFLWEGVLALQKEEQNNSEK